MRRIGHPYAHRVANSGVLRLTAKSGARRSRLTPSPRLIQGKQKASNRIPFGALRLTAGIRSPVERRRPTATVSRRPSHFHLRDAYKNGSAPNGCHCRFRNCCVICHMLCKFTSCAQEVRGSRLLPARIHSKGETAVHQDRRRSLRLSASGEPQPAAPRLANWKTRPVTKMIYFQSIMIVMVLCNVVDPPPL